MVKSPFNHHLGEVFLKNLFQAAYANPRKQASLTHLTNIRFFLLFCLCRLIGSESVAWEYSFGAWQQKSKVSQWINNRTISNYAHF